MPSTTRNHGPDNRHHPWTAGEPWLVARGALALPSELIDLALDHSVEPRARLAPLELCDAIRTTAESVLGCTLRPIMGRVGAIKRMGVGESIKEHVDAYSWRAVRFFTAVAMLSDPSHYEGGTFELRTDRAHPIHLGRGEVVVFRSRSIHSVTPVTRGERCTVVGHFEPFPRSPAHEALP